MMVPVRMKEEATKGNRIRTSISCDPDLMTWLTDLSPSLPLSRKVDAAVFVFRKYVAAWVEASANPHDLLRARAERAVDLAFAGRDVPAKDFLAYAELTA